MSKEKLDKSPYVFQKSKISYSLDIQELPWTEKQKDFLKIIQDKNTRLVFLTGPAGTSKSLLSIYCGLQALNNKKNSNIIYCRPILESADSGSKLGFLPGDKEQKEEPYKRVINEKLEELLPKGDIDKLNKENRIEFTEVNYIRGASLNAVYLIIDEAQGYCQNEIITLITRIGKYSKVIICADPSQSDLPPSKQGGYSRLKHLFSDEDAKERGIYSLEFNEDDIVRSDLCKFIVKKLKEASEDGLWSPKDSVK